MVKLDPLDLEEDVIGILFKIRFKVFVFAINKIGNLFVFVSKSS